MSGIECQLPGCRRMSKKLVDETAYLEKMRRKKKNLPLSSRVDILDTESISTSTASGMWRWREGIGNTARPARSCCHVVILSECEDENESEARYGAVLVFCSDVAP